MCQKKILPWLVAAIVWGMPAIAISGEVDVPQHTQVSATVEHGLTLYYRGDYAAAIELFAEAVADQPDDIAARYYLGYTHYRSGAYTAAREAFKQAYERNPDFVPLMPEGSAQ